VSADRDHSGYLILIIRYLKICDRFHGMLAAVGSIRASLLRHAGKHWMALSARQQAKQNLKEDVRINDVLYAKSDLFSGGRATGSWCSLIDTA
jgi:hypothetical protein